MIQGQKINPAKLVRARELRRVMTPPERKLWQELRGNKLGVHFRRQQIIAGFIADFYCHQAALVIEIDGGVHASAEQKVYDTGRDAVFSALGLKVLRFMNTEIEHDLSHVLTKIQEAINDPTQTLP